MAVERLAVTVERLGVTVERLAVTVETVLSFFAYLEKTQHMVYKAIVLLSRPTRKRGWGGWPSPTTHRPNKHHDHLTEQHSTFS